MLSTFQRTIVRNYNVGVGHSGRYGFIRIVGNAYSRQLPMEMQILKQKYIEQQQVLNINKDPQENKDPTLLKQNK